MLEKEYVAFLSLLNIQSDSEQSIKDKLNNGKYLGFLLCPLAVFFQITYIPYVKRSFILIFPCFLDTNGN